MGYGVLVWIAKQIGFWERQKFHICAAQKLYDY